MTIINPIRIPEEVILIIAMEFGFPIRQSAFRGISRLKRIANAIPPIGGTRRNGANRQAKIQAKRQIRIITGPGPSSLRNSTVANNTIWATISDLRIVSIRLPYLPFHDQPVLESATPLGEIGRAHV